MLSRLFRRWSRPDKVPVGYFLHLPKCAGTAVIAGFTQRANRPWVIVSDSPGSKRQANQALQTKLNHSPGGGGQVGLVMGHDVNLAMPRLPELEMRTAFWFTFLRHPVERYVSHFRYLNQCRQNPAHPLHAFAEQSLTMEGRVLNLEQYVEARQMPNLMAQYLGSAADPNLNSKRWTHYGNELFQLAQSALDQMDYVGFQESLAEDIDKLSRKLQISATVVRTNVTKGTTGTLSTALIRRIEQLNDLDLELYSLAKSRLVAHT